MANSRSAKKRIRINRRNNIQNNAYKSLIKYYEKIHLNLIKEYKNSEDFIEGQSTPDNVKKTLSDSFARVASRIDRAVKKKIIHKNTAIRKKNNLFKKTFTTS
uniref:30S ribosomal protein S20 n=1 Tax=Hapterophycus canaliculatus TaxID=2567908 RepID=A0A5A4MI80_9PHAE|nr:30S ribosomal protein S20 [Hapterophycus canaliculatus]AXU40716.1 30S ribosomal protein S20 [Hapterophycus canaliculatus]